MFKLFQYNWQVREDWFNWCETVPEEELLKDRVGGVGGILYTLYHIVEVEYGWFLDLRGEQEFKLPPFEACASLQKLRDVSREFHNEIEAFVVSWTSEMESLILTVPDSDGQMVSYRYGEAMRHVIAHEIHHIGQLSVWARELGRKPVTANLIDRGLFDE